MKTASRILLAAAFALTLPAFHTARAADALPPALPTVDDPRLIAVATSPRIWNGVAVAPDGRIFVSLTQSEGPGMSLAELRNGELQPFPDAQWNHWQTGADPAKHFLHVNAVRIGPDGALWAVDAGNTGIGTGAHAVPGAGKLVRIDLATNQVDRVYQFDRATQKDNSYFDDVRFHGDLAYLTDPGAVGLVVLNLKDGTSRPTICRSTTRRSMPTDANCSSPTATPSASGWINWRCRPTVVTCTTRRFRGRWRASKRATSISPI